MYVAIPLHEGSPVPADSAGAAAASGQETDTDTTDWGWIAFAVLAAVNLVLGIVWLVRRRAGRTA